jgi:hypothetical protein
VVVASLPFAPEIVIPTVRAMARLDLGMTKRYGFKPSFNQTYEVPDSPTGKTPDSAERQRTLQRARVDDSRSLVARSLASSPT